MGSKILVWCCIAGIGLGFLAPLVFKVNQQTSLMIGMAGGLGIGYVLDLLREQKDRKDGTAVLSKKARRANELMEQARAEVSGQALPAQKRDEEPAEDEGPSDEEEDTESSLAEEAEKLNNAEELLRKARERLEK